MFALAEQAGYTSVGLEGKPWVDTGPHVMVLNIGKHFEGYPTSADNPKAPYVMFATPRTRT